jgi:hypothetical protein
MRCIADVRPTRMRFTLTYSGDLRANARPDHKHHVRRAFHTQLKTLWQQPPLADSRKWFDGPSAKTAINPNRPVGAFRFVPLVSPDLHLGVRGQSTIIDKGGEDGSDLINMITKAGGQITKAGVRSLRRGQITKAALRRH